MITCNRIMYSQVIECFDVVSKVFHSYLELIQTAFWFLFFMTSAIMRRDLVRYYSLLSMLHAIMVTAWLCHDTNLWMAPEGMIVRYFKDISHSFSMTYLVVFGKVLIANGCWSKQSYRGWAALHYPAWWDSAVDTADLSSCQIQFTGAPRILVAIANGGSVPAFFVITEFII